MSERGKIKHECRAQQINDFSGILRRRNITPTDIDGAYDLSGRAFIFLEGKYSRKFMDYGQKCFYVNLCNAIRPLPAIVIVYDHFVSNCKEEVNVIDKEVSVREYYRNTDNNGWVRPLKPWTGILEVIEAFEGEFCLGL